MIANEPKTRSVVFLIIGTLNVAVAFGIAAEWLPVPDPRAVAFVAWLGLGSALIVKGENP